MKIRFAKYQGTGNDFIIINNISNSFPKDNNDLIAMLCDRKFGIGADGLILIEKNHKLDFEMKYFNSDGHIGSMCGNGARCSIHYSFVNKLIKSVTHFYACDGKHRGEINNNIVKVSINDVSKQKNVKVALCGEIAGDPHFLPLLIGLGLDTFSATGTLLPELKFFGRRFTQKEAQNLKDKICQMRRPYEIKECLRTFYEERVSDLM